MDINLNLKNVRYLEEEMDQEERLPELDQVAIEPPSVRKAPLLDRVAIAELLIELLLLLCWAFSNVAVSPSFEEAFEVVRMASETTELITLANLVKTM